MPSRKKLSPLALVALLFFACTIVYGLLSSYPRQLAVYSDELRYLDVARSLLAGRGLRVRNMPSDYQKILYPLCILPALLLKSTAAQITAIGWLNAAYMASAVFPAYALAKTMRMNPHRTVFLVGVTAVLHDVRGLHLHERDGLSAACCGRCISSCGPCLLRPGRALAGARQRAHSATCST
ncbi:MAG: hypothetical protein ACLUFT_09925 [Gemmiger formicilis]|uniref:hypothetical protein n=1 Tax=Gemmiger formicilis TaxID=745368 RepID=UPI0039918057